MQPRDMDLGLKPLEPVVNEEESSVLMFYNESLVSSPIRGISLWSAGISRVGLAFHKYILYSLSYAFVVSFVLERPILQRISLLLIV